MHKLASYARVMNELCRNLIAASTCINANSFNHCYVHCIQSKHLYRNLRSKRNKLIPSYLSELVPDLACPSRHSSPLKQQRNSSSPRHKHRNRPRNRQTWRWPPLQQANPWKKSFVAPLLARQPGEEVVLAVFLHPTTAPFPIIDLVLVHRHTFLGIRPDSRIVVDGIFPTTEVIRGVGALGDVFRVLEDVPIGRMQDFVLKFIEVGEMIPCVCGARNQQEIRHVKRGVMDATMVSKGCGKVGRRYN